MTLFPDNQLNTFNGVFFSTPLYFHWVERPSGAWEKSYRLERNPPLRVKSEFLEFKVKISHYKAGQEIVLCQTKDREIVRKSFECYDKDYSYFLNRPVQITGYLRSSPKLKTRILVPKSILWKGDMNHEWISVSVLREKFYEGRSSVIAEPYINPFDRTLNPKRRCSRIRDDYYDSGCEYDYIDFFNDL